MNGKNENIVVEIGEIWATKSSPLSPNGGQLPEVQNPVHVVILLDDKDAYNKSYPDVRIAPISNKVDQASDMDLMLSAEENPLEKDIIIEIWNSQPMLKANLSQLYGKLSDKLINQLGRLQLKLLETEIDISDIKTGAPVVDESDPRLDFQEREIEKTLYLRGPFNELVEKLELDSQPLLTLEQIQEMHKRLVAIGDCIYTAFTLPTPAGMLSKTDKKRQIYENEAVKAEIYKEGNSLFLELVAKAEELTGKFVSVTVSSAIETEDLEKFIEWEQNGPEEIISHKPIDEGRWLVIKLGKTELRFDNPHDRNVIDQIFKDIRLEIFDD
ncbi:hypothetical protein GF312_13465 [Candidatus Poribacteria bacterium]|nr:hypothetical protein [Candidatus Poribacteria bacterium]